LDVGVNQIFEPHQPNAEHLRQGLTYLSRLTRFDATVFLVDLVEVGAGSFFTLFFEAFFDAFFDDLTASPAADG
jgi:hypothetical protein